MPVQNQPAPACSQIMDHQSPGRSPKCYIPPHLRNRGAAAPVPITSPSYPRWVDPPTVPLFHSDEGDWIFTCWDRESSTQPRLREFLGRWLPSCTPSTYCAWIAVERFSDYGRRREIDRDSWNLEGLEDDFHTLIKQGKEAVTVEALDQIAKDNNVLCGKWMIFASSNSVDAIWERVVKYLCLKRKIGQAKVSSRAPDIAQGHVICVYVENYLDMEEVRQVRNELREWVSYSVPMALKPDTYTHLDIYAGNEYGIRPSRYRSDEI